MAAESTIQPAIGPALQPVITVVDCGPPVFYFVGPDGLAYLTPDGTQVYLVPEGA